MKSHVRFHGRLLPSYIHIIYHPIGLFSSECLQLIISSLLLFFAFEKKNGIYGLQNKPTEAEVAV